MGGGVQCSAGLRSRRLRHEPSPIESPRVRRGILESSEVSEVGEGGGGVFWEPKVCVQKIAPPDFLSCKFRFFPRWSLWSW